MTKDKYLLQEDFLKIALSPSEERFFHQASLHGITGIFNERCAIHIKGTLDIKALDRAFNIIIERHEVLRSYISNNENPSLVILPKYINKITYLKLDVINSSEFITNLHSNKIIAELAGSKFNIYEPPLFKLFCIDIGNKNFVLILIMHHIISDGDPSFNIIFKELTYYYNQFTSNKNNLINLTSPVKRSDLACEAFNKIYDLDKNKKSKNFWKNYLDNKEHSLVLPKALINLNEYKEGIFFEANTLVNHFKDIKIKNYIEYTEKLKEFQIQDRYKIWLSSLFAKLLQIYSGQKDIFFGLPIYGRERFEGLDKTLGYYGGVVVLRINIEGEPTLSKIQDQVITNYKKIKEYGNIPFQEVVNSVAYNWRNNSRFPLFNILFVVLPELPIDRIGDTSWELLDIPMNVLPYDAILIIRYSLDGELTFFLEHSRKYDKNIMKDMLDKFLHIIKVSLENINIEILPSDLIDQKEKESLLINFNNTKIKYPDNKNLYELFLQIHSKFKHKVAIVDHDNKKYTYDRLLRDVLTLSSVLFNNNVRKGELVGIAIDRSYKTICSYLALLRLGAIYVPLDINLPVNHLKDRVNEINLRKIIINSNNSSFIKDHFDGIATILIDNTTIESVDNNSLKIYYHKIDSDSPAYLMFTSGSTGKPKGVLVSHKNISRLVKNVDYIDLNDNTTTILYSPLSFDASTFEIWASLLNGGKIVIATQGKLSVDELLRIVKKNKVNTLWLTSGLFNITIEQGSKLLRKLRYIMVGGDVVSSKWVSKAYKMLPDTTIYNMYGPTENTTFSTYYKIDRDFITSSIPIGKPVNNSKVYVLGADMKPVPKGIPGEIYLGGDGVSLGYYNKSHDNNFINLDNDFYCNERRVYKTGDIARFITDPANENDYVIDFIGRKDNQKKVSGFRIELSEIENYLLSNSYIKSVLVDVEDDERDNKAIIAYVVLKEPIQIRDLREYLSKYLPEYMIPNKFITVSVLPLNPQGKINKKELRTNITIYSKDAINFILPVNHTVESESSEQEYKILKVWKEFLGLDRIERENNFFELGGNSLIAQKISYKLSSIFKTTINIRSIFKYPTISELAKHISKITDQNEI